MNYSNLLCQTILTSALLLAAPTSAESRQAPSEAQPIALHPENPHYFVWRGQATVLITSAEHYGAVLNLDFDYRKYLDTLADEGMNYTRIFSGAYVEPDGAFNIARNTLAPLPGRFICPWPRSEEAGYANGGNKFDLSRWDDDYFELSAGRWKAEWVDTKTGAIVRQSTVNGGGIQTLEAPPYETDIALRLLKR